ncbi:CD209 antigen-like protein C isoform X2 [Salvelinus namaycush]|uniref:CD209 antigen-like protein C isoform X2 n=1 Tax=Salvelinus namaycush TaxID=8040 RepID=A0A8U0QV42_SALNM|nr:CD209 antigen-like protein C isoform X2 [Salvelinus namaycush]XP_038850089.1 CD209 antigen-like protein C isoform X2 [Salvelinus namaycush]
MEVENYTSLHEFTEDISSRGNKPILNNHMFSLSLSLFSLSVPSVPLETAALTLKLNSVRGHYVYLCDDYSKLAQSCSKTVRKCRECPEDWIHVDEKCYSFSNDKMDWPSSRDSCTSLGSHLTILHSKEQHDALEKEARRIGGFDYHFWIGLSDIEKEGDWRWVDNTTLTNKYWNEYSSEPDNHQSGGSHGEDCATLDSHSQTWFDVPCDHIYKRICQMDAIRLD